jgi:carbamoylphosphate synthase large subunit
MAHILIVGKSFSGLKNYLIDNGHSFTVLQDMRTTKFPYKKFKNRVVADFSSYENLFKSVDNIQQERPIDGLLTTYENYILDAAHIAKHLGLPGISTEAAAACTDKERMRNLFAISPTKISPDFAVVTSEVDVEVFANNHQFPLIIKPANLSKSLLVTKSNSLDELLQNYDKTVQQVDVVYQKYAPGQQPKLLIEEFLEGPIFSVDAFVDANGEPHILENVVDYQTGYDIGYDDNFHYSRLLPSHLSSDQIKAIRKTAEAGCRALGMTSGPSEQGAA